MIHDQERTATYWEDFDDEMEREFGCKPPPQGDEMNNIYGHPNNDRAFTYLLARTATPLEVSAEETQKKLNELYALRKEAVGELARLHDAGFPENDDHVIDASQMRNFANREIRKIKQEV